jgi:cupin fold WbuC family metalloprotein
MLNALQPHSYIQPHRHRAPAKAESIVVLKGSIACVIFNEAGAIERVHVIGVGLPSFGVDLHAGVFHTFFALEPDTVLFEVKRGPYERLSDKDFASWAPEEGTPEAKPYLEQLRQMAGTA